MAVFRVERNRNYTVMANYHLQDKNLSLKAKGLLSLMLSLPDTWDYTLKGLSYICKEGVDAIRSALQELIKAGYVICSRVRNAFGQLKGADYVIYEQPQLVEKAEKSPLLAQPAQDKPMLEKPTLGFPELEHPAQSNPVTPKIYNNLLPRESNPDPSNRSAAPGSLPPSRTVQASNQIESLWEKTRLAIGYEALSDEYGREQMDEILGIIMGVLLSDQASFRIGANVYPASYVKGQFSILNSQHISYALDNMKNCGSAIHNPVAYLQKVLFNASLTLNSHIEARVRHDLYRQDERARMAAEQEAMEKVIDEISPEFWEEIKREANKAKRNQTAGLEYSLPVPPAADWDRPHGVLGYCAG